MFLSLDQECIDEPIGYHCACSKGLRLGNDSKNCIDIDECKEIFGICSNHKCINIKGGFKCECFDGCRLVDHRFCRVKTEEQPFVVFANRHDIRQAYLPANRSGPRHYNLLYRALSQTVAIDYNLVGNYLIWSDIRDEIAFEMILNHLRNLIKPDLFEIKMTWILFLKSFIKRIISEIMKNTKTPLLESSHRPVDPNPYEPR